MKKRERVDILIKCHEERTRSSKFILLLFFQAFRDIVASSFYLEFLDNSLVLFFKISIEKKKSQIKFIRRGEGKIFRGTRERETMHFTITYDLAIESFSSFIPSLNPR